MSHIINNNKDIEKLLFIIDLIRKNGLNQELVEETLKIMLPKEKNQTVKYKITEKIFEPAYFFLLNQTLYLSLANIDKIIKKEMSIIQVSCDCNKDDLYGYLCLHLLSHEIEHVYEYLIGSEMFDIKYKIIIDYYKQIYNINSFHFKNFLKYFRILPLAIKNDRNILERNANVESLDLMYQIACYENNKSIKEIAYNLKQLNLIRGYEGKYNGIIEEAYKRKIFITKSSIYENSIPLGDKVRYGLPLDEDTKKKVLNYEFA